MKPVMRFNLQTFQSDISLLRPMWFFFCYRRLSKVFWTNTHTHRSEVRSSLVSNWVIK